MSMKSQAERRFYSINIYIKSSRMAKDEKHICIYYHLGMRLQQLISIRIQTVQSKFFHTYLSHSLDRDFVYFQAEYRGVTF